MVLKQNLFTQGNKDMHADAHTLAYTVTASNPKTKQPVLSRSVIWNLEE